MVFIHLPPLGLVVVVIENDEPVSPLSGCLAIPFCIPLLCVYPFVLLWVSRRSRMRESSPDHLATPNSVPFPLRSMTHCGCLGASSRFTVTEMCVAIVCLHWWCTRADQGLHGRFAKLKGGISTFFFCHTA